MLGNLSFGELVAFFVSLLIGMTLHEAMHAYAGHALGDTTARDMGRLTLNPLKHIDIVTTLLLPVVLVAIGLPPILAARPVPFNPDRLKYDEFGAALLAIAGPLTNLALALVGAFMFRFGHVGSPALANYLEIFVLTNVGMFIFNMIPFPPLDGSRVLYAFAPEPIQAFMRQIEGLGFFVILIFFVLIFQTGLGTGLGNLYSSLASHLLGIPV